ncbi:MAG: hypothetical protein K0Q78_2246, partial [Cellvibrio sp.]|nr:hypothetical protein [Cellvibrio sp.]
MGILMRHLIHLLISCLLLAPAAHADELAKPLPADVRVV